MAVNITELSASVRESVASIEEMTYSMREVARNVDALSLTAEETASSMNEMDVSIDQVQSNASETARLSEEVARDAETGADAILKTIEEIHRMRDSSSAAVRVMSNLDAHIAAVGKILSVIGDVAEQTNLLALNAAIIAAQILPTAAICASVQSRVPLRATFGTLRSSSKMSAIPSRASTQIAFIAAVSNTHLVIRQCASGNVISAGVGCKIQQR